MEIDWKTNSSTLNTASLLLRTFLRPVLSDGPNCPDSLAILSLTLKALTDGTVKYRASRDLGARSNVTIHMVRLIGYVNTWKGEESPVDQ